MQTSSRCAALCIAALVSAPVAASSSSIDARVRNELFLAGGALHVCSSVALRDCARDDVFADAPVRGASTYVLDDAGIAAIDHDTLWSKQAAQRVPLLQVLRYVQRTRGSAPMSADAVGDALDAMCVDTNQHVVACAKDARGPWSRLDDDGQSMVLAAFEAPQRDAGGARIVERASLEHSRNPHGVAVLRAFVAAARTRTPDARPRVAVVTASAFDPFDPVDFYIGALQQAGADVEWWPVDAALARAVFESRDCDTLPALRDDVLRLPRHAHVYPDLHAQQQAACRDPQALAAVPGRVQGVFFTGGDQWRLRRAFFDAGDMPNAWLLALRGAVERGDVVIGGTSAGSAVQSGGPMLSNGTPVHAMVHGARASAPPAPGCTRAGECIDALDEDTMTFWPAGGLGLAPGVIVDTHFSERDRELRLLRLLTQTGTRWGVGADEASALHMTWAGDGGVQVDAIGASGGWVFDTHGACVGPDLRATAHYLAPGARLRIDAMGATSLMLDEATDARMPPTPKVDRDSDHAALRDATQRLATSPRVVARPDGLPRVTLRRGERFRAWPGGNGLHGAFDIALEVDDWPTCTTARTR